MLKDVGVGVVGYCQMQVLNMLRKTEGVFCEREHGSDLQFLQFIDIAGNMFSADVEAVLGERVFGQLLGTLWVLLVESVHVQRLNNWI